MEDLAKKGGNVEIKGSIEFGLINAIYIVSIAYGVHEMKKPTLI
jgi:hypothetical protein